MENKAPGNSITYSPIGYFQSEQKRPYEAGRQPDEHHAPGMIQLQGGQNFEQALTGLEEFSHLWVLFQFHHNENWKPMISPPRGATGKVGVFASRAPYRPNNIGMSVVRLQKIENLKIYVTEADILDGSPILDIKPYLSYVDSKPDATLGWIANEEKYVLEITALAREQLDWLKAALPGLQDFLHHQLEFEPTNHKKKRVRPKSPAGEDLLEAGGSLQIYTLAYKTWRVDFSLNPDPSSKTLEILKITSGYSSEDLQKKEDPYVDKDLHRQYIQKFQTSF